MTTALTTAQADAVYDLLVQYAGAPASPDSWARRDFIDHQTIGSTDEYRFQGALGFGGKFWRDAGRWYVTCYPEDMTLERQAIIDATNGALAQLQQAVTA